MMSTPSDVHAPAHPDDGTVFQLVADWAMHARRPLLTAVAIVGLVDAAAVVVLLPSLWLLATPLMCLSSIGAWGLASQNLLALDAAPAPPSRRRLVVLAVRTAAATVGMVAAILGLYGILLKLLGGRWI
jgi:hypothetical protein